MSVVAAEAAAKFGEDPRKYSMLSKRFLTDDAGNLTGLEVCKVKFEAGVDGGRPSMVEVEGTTEVIECDLAFLALGFLGPEDYLAKALDLDTDPRSNFKADTLEYETSVPVRLPNVFHDFHTQVKIFRITPHSCGIS